ncbi:hypothetical protein I317_03813 [Kwoniella heveanensis CBS 569]|nr:hypothetical protein I317_03813 [Kwoniella heveanensis CBS 569]
MATLPQDPNTPNLTRAESGYSSEGKVDVEQREFASAVPGVETIAEDNDQVGYATFKAAQDRGYEPTPEESKRVLRRIDLFILPIFTFTQCLQFMDKSALNYANLFGYQKALGLKGSNYSWLGGGFYVGYLVAQFPMGYLLGRFPAGRVLGVSCLIWGLLVLLSTQAKDFKSAMTVRILLGMMEAVVTPGLNLMTGFWYTKRETPNRQTLWYSALGLGGIIGGFIATGISKRESTPAIPNWAVIFWILGAITMAWALVLYFVLADSPSKAFWLNEDQKFIAVQRVSAGMVGIKSKKFKISQVKAAFLDPKTYLLFIATFATSIPTGVLSNFSTVIIRDIGFDSFETTLMDVVRNVFQMIGVIGAGYIATRFKNTRIIMCTFGNVVCITAAACLAYLPASAKWARLVALWFTNFQSIGFVLGLVMISSNIGGYTKKQFTSGLIFVAYCAGNIAGPQFVYSHEAPRYRTATNAMVASYSIKTLAHLLLGAYMFWDNKRRDRKSGGIIDEKRGAEAGMLDVTEFENPDFRYVL